MSEYHHLIGAEDVARAGSSMREAANQMDRAASELSHTLSHSLLRFEQAATMLRASIESLTAKLGEIQQEAIQQERRRERRSGPKPCTHLKGSCIMCHQCLLDQGESLCPACAKELP